MYITERSWYKYGNEGDEIETTIIEHESFEKAYKYAHRYACGRRFAKVTISDNNYNEVYELSADGQEFWSNYEKAEDIDFKTIINGYEFEYEINEDTEDLLKEVEKSDDLELKLAIGEDPIGEDIKLNNFTNIFKFEYDGYYTLREYFKQLTKYSFDLEIYYIIYNKINNTYRRSNTPFLSSLKYKEVWMHRIKQLKNLVGDIFEIDDYLDIDLNIDEDENNNEITLEDMGDYLLLQSEDDTEVYKLKYEYINDTEVVIINVE